VGAGKVPVLKDVPKNTEPIQVGANPKQNNALGLPPDKHQEQNSTLSIHSDSTSLQSKCVPDVYQNDLAKVVGVWDELTAEAREKIIEITLLCTQSVYQNDLAKVVSAWNELSTDAKQRIVEIVEQNH
jgi:hypothetical protein